MAADSAGIGMSALQSQYETIVTRHPGKPAQWYKILDLDPQRLWVQFFSDAGVVGLEWVLPGPIPDSIGALGGTNIPYESKWKDCPAVTSGEWYAQTNGGAVIISVQCRLAR